MIKKFIKLSTFLFVSFMLFSCAMSGEPSDSGGDGKLLVTFNSQGGTLISRQVLDQYSSVTKPESPVKPGYTFAGWYLDNRHICSWDFNSDTVTDDITLYAKWDPSAASGMSEFYLVNSPAASKGRLDILYNSTYSGTVRYIVSTNNLGIESSTAFSNTFDPAKDKEVTITADTSGNPVYDDYIEITGLASGRKYYVYIMDTGTGELKVLTRTTNTGSVLLQENGTLQGYNSILSYTITFPKGYDSSSSAKWPLVLSFKAPDFTAADPNFPCITFYTDIPNPNQNTTQICYDIEQVRKRFTSVIEDSSYRIDRNRIYACGFSLGGCAVMRIANNDGSDRYKIAAIAANGISGWIGSRPDWTGNLGDTNTWVSLGENDPYGADTAYANMPKNTGDHFLSIYPGVAHDSSPTWKSPYTYMWLLSK